jgi:hypothetical protein
VTAADGPEAQAELLLEVLDEGGEVEMFCAQGPAGS